MKPLRIVHSEAATSFGGQERHIYNEMLAMRERGHHMEAITQPDAQLTEYLVQEGFTVHTLPMDGPVNYWRGIWHVRRVLRQGRFDVLNTHSRRDTMLVGLAGRIARVPLVVRTRHLARRPNSLVSYTGIPHRVTTTSEAVRQQLLERHVPGSHVAAVYSPVDVPEARRKGVLRHELGLSENDLIVGCVAVLRRAKGHAELIDAMLPLLRARSSLHLVIIGSGSPVFEQLQALITEFQLGEQIHLLGRRNDVHDLLADFDIFALATREEALGKVFIEAAAAGVPVVATNVGGVSETMQSGKTGFLVPLDDVAALTSALEQLINDPSLRRRMGDAGRDFYHCSGRFTTEALVANTEHHYYRWLKERRA